MDVSAIITLILAVLLLGYFIYLIYNKKWDDIRKLAFGFMKSAERVYTGSKQGKQKFNFVFHRVYELIPGWLRFFVSEECLREKLQQWYDLMKDKLDDGKINNSL